MSAGRQEVEEQSCKKGSSFYPLHICQAETKKDDQKRLLFDLQRQETLSIKRRGLELTNWEPLGQNCSEVTYMKNTMQNLQDRRHIRHMKKCASLMHRYLQHCLLVNCLSVRQNGISSQDVPKHQDERKQSQTKTMRLQHMLRMPSSTEWNTHLMTISDRL